MPVMNQWELSLDVDQVLRGQGADPAALRQRSPRLVELAEQAIEEGTPLLNPALVFQRLAVEGIHHERIKLEGGRELRGKLIAQHLAPAREVLLILCTVGENIEMKVSQVMENDMVYALAMDGFGTAAVEALANAACHHFEVEAKAENLENSIPLSPGMVDWSVEEAQPQLFDLLDSEEIGMKLTQSLVMIPRKSLSMVIGVGESMIAGTTCDYCSMREVCRYQDHYTFA